MNHAAFLFGLRARVGEKEALAAHHGSFEDEQAAVFAGVDCVDLFVEGLLIHAEAVDEHRHDMRVAQAGAEIFVAGVVCGSCAFARPFLLRLF